jgi:pyroglutamyl-peptidase
VTRVLLTGFEPFEQQRVNASWSAVQLVCEAWDPAVEGATVVTARLPVSFEDGPRQLVRLLAEIEPDLVVAVGEAGGRSAVSIERVAINVQDARIPDGSGAQPVDVAVRDDGPVAYFSSLPIKSCMLAVRDTGTPVEVSNSAGTYVCNAVFYALADFIASSASAGRGQVRGGFVHVPRMPSQVEVGDAALESRDSATGLAAIVRAALRSEVDEPVAAGALS